MINEYNEPIKSDIKVLMIMNAPPKRASKGTNGYSGTE